MCRGLVVVDEKQDSFRLSHLSVKEYLEALGKGSHKSIQDFNFEVTKMHAMAALTCLFCITREERPNVWAFPGSGDSIITLPTTGQFTVAWRQKTGKSAI